MSGSVEVLWLAENSYHVGAGLQEHSHQEYYQIYYVMEGRGVFLVNHESVNFLDNIFFLLAPEMSHGIDTIQGNTSARIVEIKFVLPEGELKDEVSKLPAVCRGTDGLQKLLYQVFLEGVQKEAHYEDMVACLFTAWLYQVIRLNKNFEPDLKKGNLHPRPATAIKRYINEHFQQDISLDQLAQSSGYSKNYLCRIFRDNTGMTINQYLNEVRISKAVDLLAGTDLDLAEVARRCGYHSVFYFIKSFKKCIGVPPGSYRKSELTGEALVRGRAESVNSAMRASQVLLLHTEMDEK